MRGRGEEEDEGGRGVRRRRGVIRYSGELELIFMNFSSDSVGWE